MAQLGKVCCYLISVGLSIALYASFTSNDVTFQSCCITSSWVECLANEADCNPPDDKNFVFAYDNIAFDDGRCIYHAQWEDSSMFVGERDEYWNMHCDEGDICFSDHMRSSIYEDESVYQKFEDMALASMILTIVAIIPCFGSCVNATADIILGVIVISGAGGYGVVSTDRC
eukprot:868462_1